MTYLKIVSLILVLTACNIAIPDNATPTFEILVSDTPTQAISATPTSTPSPTVTEAIVSVPVVVSSPLPTQEIAPILNTTPTPEALPCEATVQDGQTLIQVLSLNPCGNQVTNSLVASVVSYNDNITNPDFVSPGLTFFVPLPTPTPLPEGANMTETASAERGIVIVQGSALSANTEIGCYTVEEGDSIIGIAQRYNTTLELLRPLNQNLNWGGCDFANPSGGPNCNPGINPETCINVPLPTSVPTSTQTPSGRETTTPTPLHRAPRIISPPQGVTASQRVTLEWVSAGLLQADETYLIDFEDQTAGRQVNYITNSNRYQLPDDLIPNDGTTHAVRWRVRVAVINADGSYTPIDRAAQWYTFNWQSR